MVKIKRKDHTMIAAIVWAVVIFGMLWAASKIKGRRH